MARGATYSRSSGPVSLRLRLVATGVNRLDHFCLLGPLRASMCLPLPLCALKVVARAPVACPLFQFSIPTVFRPNSAYSTSSPALWLFISRMSYTRCPAFAAQPASFVPVSASPALDLSSRLSSQFRSRSRLFSSRNRLLRGRNRLLPRRPRSQDLLGEGCTLSR